jgi:NTP pyrophosphatase (non-canonical NTP hydrolase)
VAGVTLDELAVRVREFAAARSWEQFHTPKNLAMALAGEVGELVAELQWLTPEEADRVVDNPEAAGRMRAELGDVTIFLVRLADVLGVDLVEAARVKFAESPAAVLTVIAVTAPAVASNLLAARDCGPTGFRRFFLLNADMPPPARVLRAAWGQCGGVQGLGRGSGWLADGTTASWDHR